jgi:hypothetical protein
MELVDRQCNVYHQNCHSEIDTANEQLQRLNTDPTLEYTPSHQFQLSPFILGSVMSFFLSHKPFGHRYLGLLLARVPTDECCERNGWLVVRLRIARSM